VSRKDRALNLIDRALLGGMMLSLAFVLEKALDRMVEAKPEEERERAREGHGLLKRLMRGVSAHVQHDHAHTADKA
jgi:hypothetical protein